MATQETRKKAGSSKVLGRLDRMAGEGEAGLAGLAYISASDSACLAAQAGAFEGRAG